MKTRLTDRLGNPNGFTLVELMMSMLIIGILAMLGTMYLGDIRNQSSDRQAATEGRHILTAISDAVLAGEDVLFDGADPDGYTGAVGDTDTGGGVRDAIFTVSRDVRVSIDGENTDDPADADIEVKIWNVKGTPDPLATNTQKRKEYVFYISEEFAIVSMPDNM